MCGPESRVYKQGPFYTLTKVDETYMETSGTILNPQNSLQFFILPRKQNF